jgi:hypothetical protein
MERDTLGDDSSMRAPWNRVAGHGDGGAELRQLGCRVDGGIGLCRSIAEALVEGLERVLVENADLFDVGEIYWPEGPSPVAAHDAQRVRESSSIGQVVNNFVAPTERGGELGIGGGDAPRAGRINIDGEPLPSNNVFGRGGDLCKRHEAIAGSSKERRV